MLGRIATTAAALHGQAWARGYDLVQERSERAGMREIRAELVGEARGRTIELGAGTGLNLAHYPDALDELVLTEPDPHMAARLRERLGRLGRDDARVVEAPAERLPFESGRFDTAVVTMILCTTPDPRAALREIARVLAPGGRLLFLEHVRAPQPAFARLQDLLNPLWRPVGNGCHCNRDTGAIIAATSPFAIERVERGEIPKAIPLVKPMVRGSALRA